MSLWSVEFLPAAEKDLAKLGLPTRRRIIEKLEWLTKNFDNILPASLTGEFKDFYKFRVGDWRVFYKIDWDSHLLIVCYIARRDEAYKRR